MSNIITPETQKSIYDLYILHNKSSIEIAKILNLNASSVIYYVKKQGGSIRKMKDISKKYNFCETMFETIDCEEKAYWLGFILADGYLNVSRHTFELNLSNKDYSHLQKFKKFINSTHSIKKYYKKYSNSSYTTTDGFCSIRLISNVFCDHLLKLGIDNKKTFNCEIPIIDESLYKFFWRGVLDGDGWITMSKYYTKKTKERYNLEIGICGNKNVIIEFQNFLKKYLDLDTIIKEDKKIFRIRLNNIRALEFLNHIYENASIFLERKYEKYLFYKDYKNKLN